VDVAALAGVMAADAELLPGHADDAVGADPTAYPVLTAAVAVAGHGVRRGKGGAPAWNRWAGGAIFNA
jgi:hypothetical protein